MLLETALFYWFKHHPLAVQLWTQEALFFQMALHQKNPENVLQLGVKFMDYPACRFVVRQSMYLAADICAKDDQTPWRNHQFDSIIAAHCVDYAPSLVDFFIEMYRISQASGYLILTAFNPYSLWRLWQNTNIPNIKNAIPLSQVINIAQSVGWQVENKQFLYCWPPVARMQQPLYHQWETYARSHLWRHGAAVYALILSKQIVNMQPQNICSPLWCLEVT